MKDFTKNLRYLSWLDKKRHYKSISYKEYLSLVASRCQVSLDRYIELLKEKSPVTDTELTNIVNHFEFMDEDSVKYMEEDVFDSEIEKCRDELINENIIYLLGLIPWGGNQEFIDKLGIQASTLTRWKSGKMKPTKFYQEQICQYFGVEDAEHLENAYLFFGLSPATTQEKRTSLKNMIDEIDREKLDLLYPALVKLLG